MAIWPFERDSAAVWDQQQLQQWQQALIDILRGSGPVSLQYFRAELAVDNKLQQGFDPVTEADRACEAYISAQLQARLPAHNMFGEESGYSDRGGELCWVVDPIDGTRSFICGVPLWGTLMALNDGKRPILGGMYQPWSDELYVGSAAGAHFWRGEQRSELRCSAVRRLEQAKLACTGPYVFSDPAALGRFNALAERVRLVRYGTDCYGYALLAQGGLDLVVEDNLQPYDIQAMIPIIEGAGGVVSDWQGGDASLGGQVLAAANAELHAQAVRCLNSA